MWNVCLFKRVKHRAEADAAEEWAANTNTQRLAWKSPLLPNFREIGKGQMSLVLKRGGDISDKRFVVLNPLLLNAWSHYVFLKA